MHEWNYHTTLLCSKQTSIYTNRMSSNSIQDTFLNTDPYSDIHTLPHLMALLHTQSSVRKPFILRFKLINYAFICLGEKEGMLINDECSSWHNRVGNFLVSIWDRRKQLLYTDRSACMTQQINPTLQSARSMALSAMMVECERFIYLFYIYLAYKKG